MYMYLDMDTIINIDTKHMHIYGYNIWPINDKYDGQDKVFTKFKLPIEFWIVEFLKSLYHPNGIIVQDFENCNYSFP
jgi:hypothetical protein